MRPEDLRIGDRVTWNDGRMAGTVQSVHKLMVNIQVGSRVKTLPISKLRKDA